MSALNPLILSTLLVVGTIAQAPFYEAKSQGFPSLYDNLQNIDAPAQSVQQMPDVDAHRILGPIISPFMQMYEQMQENSRARAEADKIVQDRENHPLSTSKSLWEVFSKLQQPSTTTTEQPPLIERLFQPYIEPWKKQLDDFSKDVAGITLIPTSTTTTAAPTTTTTQNILEKSLSMFFPSLRRKPVNPDIITTTTTQRPKLFDPEVFEKLFFGGKMVRRKRQAEAPKVPLSLIPPPPSLFHQLEKPILELANPFTPNPYMAMFTTGKPLLPTPKPYGLEDMFPTPPPPLPGLPTPDFKLQDPFYNPLFPNRKSKLFDVLAGGQAARLLG